MTLSQRNIVYFINAIILIGVVGLLVVSKNLYSSTEPEPEPENERSVEDSEALLWAR